MAIIYNGIYSVDTADICTKKGDKFAGIFSLNTEKGTGESVVNSGIASMNFNKYPEYTVFSICFLVENLPEKVPAPEDAQVVSGIYYKAPIMPAVIGKQWSGWYIDASYTTEYVDGTEIKASMKLYSKYADEVIAQIKKAKK